MENQNLTIVNPQDFNVSEEKGLQVIEAFKNNISERDILLSNSSELMSKDITQFIAKEAKELRLKLSKERTAIAKIHKSEKEFYLSAGRFVDAIKNKLTTPIEIAEEKLEEIELFFINQEKARIENLKNERVLKIQNYSEFVPFGLDFALMSDSEFDKFFENSKFLFEHKQEDERLRIEKEEEEKKIIELHNERSNKLLPYWLFLGKESEANLGLISEDEFNSLLNNGIDLLEKDKLEKERIKLENEELKRKQEEIEKQKQDEIDALRKEKDAEISRANEAEKELKRKQEEEIRHNKKIEEDRILEEKLAKKLAKAPIKKQLNSWVDSFELPTNPNHESCENIIQKFNAFKVWAKNEIENI